MLLKIWNQYRARSYLFKGAIKGNLVLVKKALKFGANINSRSFARVLDSELDNKTPLCLALENKNIEVAQFLLEQGANPFEKWNNEFSGASMTIILRDGLLNLLEMVASKYPQEMDWLYSNQINAIEREDFDFKGDKIPLMTYFKYANPEAAQIWEVKLEQEKLKQTLPNAIRDFKIKRI